jgi:hypothetical protein
VPNTIGPHVQNRPVDALVQYGGIVYPAHLNRYILMIAFLAGLTLLAAGLCPLGSPRQWLITSSLPRPIKMNSTNRNSALAGLLYTSLNSFSWSEVFSRNPFPIVATIQSKVLSHRDVHTWPYSTRPYVLATPSAFYRVQTNKQISYCK